MTILNACKKKVWKLIEGATYIIHKNIHSILVTNQKKSEIEAQSAKAVEYTLGISAVGYKPPIRTLDMKLNHLLRKIEEYRVPLHCHCSHVHSDRER